MNNLLLEEDETLRKGPWTEHEDVQLVFYVNMFGDRRWDFIAKVSGLKRTGKSCRLRWVNYLNPGLKRGRMTPHEERLILEYHSKWGNRWSRIARKLPGRTDNEIKNYWRTLMRKKAQENKRTISSSPSSSFSNTSSSSSSTCTNDPMADLMLMSETKERSFYDTGGIEMVPVSRGKNNSVKKHGSVTSEEQEGIYTMDDIWKDLDLLENDGVKEALEYSCSEVTEQVWDYSFWMMDGGGAQEEFSTNMFFPGISEELTG